MALQSSGQISLKNIRDFFKGPNNFKAFYRNGNFVVSYSPQNDFIGIINSGNNLSIKQFYGAVRPIPGVSISSNATLGSGNVPAGAVLTASGIPTSGTNTIQWIRGFSVVQNGGNQYTVKTADNGSTIYVKVQNNEFDFEATSNVIGVAAGYPGSNTGITTYGTFTVPAYVTSLEFDISGGGGGGGGVDAALGGKGGNAGRLTGAIPVNPGDTITVRIGNGGGGGRRSAGAGSDVGDGGNANGSLHPGGNGGLAGSQGTSGTGGGGGGATVIYKNTSETGATINVNRANPSIVLVAGGGGGGGGAGKTAGGSGNPDVGRSGQNGAGLDGKDTSNKEDGGGGGGGGGGRPSGLGGSAAQNNNPGGGGDRGDNYFVAGISISSNKSDGSAGGAGGKQSGNTEVIGVSGTKGYARFSWIAYY